MPILDGLIENIFEDK
jgi:dynein heavy chain, axonemal